MHPSKTLTISINCPARKMYEFVSTPENMPKWATTFVRSIKREGKGWVIDTPQGSAGVRFAPKNEHGILDHTVIPAPGVEVFVPMRVVPNGAGCEMIFTLFRLPQMTDASFANDLSMVERDLQTLKQVIESQARAENR